MARIGRPLAMSTGERKAAIFLAVEGLLAERGYDRLTMGEIATAAGMSKRTLYQQFADKSALLGELVTSSYLWPEGAFEGDEGEPVAGLRLCVRVMIEHVLSERHIRLCRLAIGESAVNQELAQAFLAMGIGRSRERLISSIEAIPAGRCALRLPSDVLAGMLYGATCGLRLSSALLTGVVPDIAEAHAAAEVIIAQLFP